MDPLEILYKSNNFIVVHKPHDLKINSVTDSEVTLATRLAAERPELYDPEVAFGFRFVHRLDYATSGAICIALKKSSARVAQRLFEQQRVKKLYLALVRGYLPETPDEGLLIEKAIGLDGRKDNHGFAARYCTGEHAYCQSPRSAVTVLHVLEQGLYDGAPATKVLLVPHTGRTHQLRVHCASVGHLIVGDYTYSDRVDSSPHRMMLHAYRLALCDNNPAGESFDVSAGDPLMKLVDIRWQPSKVYKTVRDCSGEGSVNEVAQEAFTSDQL